MVEQRLQRALRSITILPSVDSSNRYLCQHASELPSPALVVASEQWDGRGQKGNRWMMHPGDLALSLLYRPILPLPLSLHFAVVEAVSLAVVRILGRYGVPVSIKWPNDLLYEGEKFCGILVESSTRSSSIHTLIVGVGINLTTGYHPGLDFRWPPTTLHGLLASSCSPISLAMDISEAMIALFASVERGEGSSLHAEYLRNLYRRQGLHPFQEHGRAPFLANIVTVQPDGQLLLRDESGVERAYLFKEVQYLPAGNTTFAENSLLES